MTSLDSSPSPVDFRCAPVVEPFLGAARPIASAIRDIGGAEAVSHIQQLELASVLPELERRADAPVLLFHLAELLGHANLAAAWQGLSGIPARAAELPASVDLAALPDATGTRWTAWLPVVDAARPPSLALAGPRGWAPLPAQGLTHSRVSGLLGFARGEVLTWSTEPSVTPEELGVQSLAPESWSALVRAQLALLSGLLVGATRRLVDEAYAYAKTRQSAGKSINQHQAVALRLADLALHQEALSLYLTARVEECRPPGMRGGPESLSAGYVVELAFRIARDAVQTAAGHGYVEGLPFRRLFEQVRTLTVMLQGTKAAAEPVSPVP
ncbi:acyl-CoA dehydrogenase family protein [Myxococcus sp. K15C18031901]|uniref:acyl-CoA dehydrogenase family protein n=1 Tax=Myxococcus dinghuensis TaxID=2906761 RepID=UPI0020A77CDC|nr:acyl-CoA dehydrogenase family protein [Myxococcus dinghuensis]MCP3102890.1 acyl-CoA dehydrogenase family protein [Myxococcus dinghuensis]